MAQTYAARYLAKAAMSAPRDLVRSAVAKYTPLHPTVFIFHCTFVCDAEQLPCVGTEPACYALGIAGQAGAGYCGPLGP